MERLPQLVPISSLNKGQAGKVIENVKKNNDVVMIVKNNEAEAVIISVDMYNEMASYYRLRETADTVKKHAGAGALSKYAKAELVGKEEDLYHEALDLKYTK